MNQGADNTEANPSLLELAVRKFGDLTQAEQIMFEKAEEGDLAKCAFNGDTNPAEADAWDDARAIHADRIAWLCTDPIATPRVTHKGIQVRAARIEGELDLQFARIPFPLAFVGCAFTGPIDLQHAEVRSLHLDGLHAKSICAHGVKVEGGVNLRNGFLADGEVGLIGASIGGNLECDNATFSNSGGYCLNANGAKVRRSVFLREGFSAHGEVCLVRASIGGNLECDRARFNNPDDACLNAEGVKVEGTVFLCDGFEAHGCVSLAVAEVRQYLHWREVKSPNKATLDLRSAKIGALWDDEESWPAQDNLYLQGLEYGEIAHHAPSDAKSRIKWLRLQREEEFPTAAIRVIARELREKGVKGLPQWIGGTLNAERAPHEDDVPWRELDRKLREVGAGDVADRIQEVLDAPRKPSFSPQPYEQLATVLKRQGHDQDAKDILVAKNEDPAFRKRMSCCWKVWYCIYGTTTDYGPRPLKARWFFALFLVLGCVLFGVGYYYGLITPSNVPPYSAQVGTARVEIAKDYPKFNFIMYSIDTFVPIVNLHQQGYWLPNPNEGFICHTCGIPVSWGGLLRLYLWIHIAAGWVLTTLFVVGLTGLIRS